VEVLPRAPGHHLVEVNVGVFNTHSFAPISNVAVVSKP